MTTIRIFTNPYVSVENKSDFYGSDTTGTSGEAGRTLTLSNNSLSSNESVFLDGVLLREGRDYEITHKNINTEIVFLLRVWNNQSIRVQYYT